jgi:hypothetical protein
VPAPERPFAAWDKLSPILMEPSRTTSLLKPLLVCWFLAAFGEMGAGYYLISFFHDIDHSSEYLEGAWMALYWAIPACAIVSVGSMRNRSRFTQAQQILLNGPSILCAIAIIATLMAHRFLGHSTLA